MCVLMFLSCIQANFTDPEQVFTSFTFHFTYDTEGQQKFNVLAVGGTGWYNHFTHKLREMCMYQRLKGKCTIVSGTTWNC